MTKKDEFIEIYRRYIKRDGAAQLLDYLENHSDFFVSPASTRFHMSFEGGLVAHSVNVYQCLKAYMERERVKETYGLTASDEAIAVIGLLHDVCKTNCYKKSFRNVKDEKGQWQKVPSYEFDDPMPYGHGEKSVYIISGFMRLSREEAFAIRYHMGFAGNEDTRNVGDSFRLYPLSFALSTADMEATYFLENQK